MSHKYTPLEPLYLTSGNGQRLGDEEIGMATLHRAQPEARSLSNDDSSSSSASASTSSSANECERARGCKSACEQSCATANPRRTCLAKVARCLAVTFMVGAIVWMISAAAVVSYVGIKAHRCLHPRHMAVQEFHYSPKDLSNLELGLVAGSLNIRSCAHAKNITLTVRTFAGTEALLTTMVVEKSLIPNGHRIVVEAPSFDFTHCQHATYDLVVPENAQLDVKAQALLARLSIRADERALRHVLINAKAAHVDIADTHVAGTLRVETEIGYIRVKEVTAGENVVTEVRTGVLSLKEVEANNTFHSSLRFGKASLNHVSGGHSLKHESEMAYVSMWNVTAGQNLSVRVDFGSLNFAANSDYHGTFAARSPFGFLTFRQADQVEGVKVTKETLDTIEGTVAHVGVSGLAKAPKHLDLDALYGSISMFIAGPETQYERKHKH